MYAMVCTKPDITQGVSVVGRNMKNLGKAHWFAVKWIFRYLRGTSNDCIEYKKNNDGLQGFVDSDFGVDLDQTKSTSGYVLCLGGSAISRRSSLEGVIA